MGDQEIRIQRRFILMQIKVKQRMDWRKRIRINQLKKKTRKGNGVHLQKEAPAGIVHLLERVRRGEEVNKKRNVEENIRKENIQDLILKKVMMTIVMMIKVKKVMKKVILVKKKKINPKKNAKGTKLVDIRGHQ